MTYEQKKLVIYAIWILSCATFMVSIFLFNTTYDKYAPQIALISLLVGASVFVVLVGSNRKRTDNIILATGTSFMVLFVVLIPSIMTLIGRTYEEEKLPVKDREVLCYVEGLEITTTADNCKKLNDAKSNKEITTPTEQVRTPKSVTVPSPICHTNGCGDLQISENECNNGTCCEVDGNWKWAKTESICEDWQERETNSNGIPVVNCKTDDDKCESFKTTEDNCILFICCEVGDGEWDWVTPKDRCKEIQKQWIKDKYGEQ